MGALALAGSLAAGAAAPAHAQVRFNQQLLSDFSFRNLGPFRAGAWITDFAVPDAPARSHRNTFYVGTRNGGVWKTENAGTTFQPIFDATGQSSVGAVAVAPSNENIVWVGTGESFVARYSYPGDGVYKSTDGGRTWQNMGLRDSHHIAEIVVHPRNPDIVYVASMGHLHTLNSERGVFRTDDGGKTWRKVLFVSDGVGVIELVMDPQNPDVLYASAYDKVRYPWHLEIAGKGSGIYKTTDGGRNWSRLEGGFPGGRIGRIGIDVYRRNPKILYALVENANPRPALAGRERVIGGIGEVYRSEDAGTTWRKTHADSLNIGGKAPYSFNQLRIDPNDDQRIWITSVWLAHSPDGGKTWVDLENNRGLFRRMFGDVRTVWIDPEDSNRMLVGSDGGVNITYDQGRSVDHLYNLPLGEVYGLAVDMENPYNIYVGLQDHESWRGPSNGFAGTIGIENWKTVGTGDGMYNAVDPTDSRWAYNTLQFGGHVRVDQQLATLTNIAPRRPRDQSPYRYTWTTPIVLSPHDPKTLYTGAQVVLRSRDRGDTWQEISGDLTTNDSTKINGHGNIQFCTITTVAESPVTRGEIWAGTDDGRVHVSRDDGKTWTDATRSLVAAGFPAGYWVTRVVPSRHRAGTAFVTVTGFHRDDFRPFVYRTDDYGATWKALATSLTAAAAHVLAEDVRNANLLFLGTDHGLFVSIDGGVQWTRFQSNLAPAPVRDLIVHPRENDLVVGTHGRSVWIADIAPLQEITEELLARRAHLFAVEPKGWRVESGWGNYRLYGDRALMTPNEPNGISIAYYQRDAADGAARVRITDASGTVVRTLPGPAGSGIRRIVWNLRNEQNRMVEAGLYTATLELKDVTLTEPVRVQPSVVVPR